MSFRVLYHALNKLTHVFGLIFLCIAYFYYCRSIEPVSVFFRISYFIGQILVNKFLVLCNLTVETVFLIYSFFQVLYEDSLIFVNDASEKFTYVIQLFKNIYLCLEELGWICVKGIYGAGEALISAVGVLQYTIASARYGIHVTGSTIWRFLMHLPGTIILKINDINLFILNTLKDLINSVFVFFNSSLECLQKLYLFFFDIPLDSVYGLIICAVLVSVIYIKFHDICMILSSAAVKFCKKIINFGINLWTGRYLEKKSQKNFYYTPDDDERLCIICQYHPKEIIIFPCKHLCLCQDCSLQVTKIRPKCPICRSKISKTLKVYL